MRVLGGSFEGSAIPLYGGIEANGKQNSGFHERSGSRGLTSRAPSAIPDPRSRVHFGW